MMEQIKKRWMHVIDGQDDDPQQRFHGVKAADSLVNGDALEGQMVNAQDSRQGENE